MEYAALRFWSALADGDLDRLRAARATEVGGALRGNAARVDLPRARTQQQQRGGAASPLAARPARAVASGQQPRSRVGGSQQSGQQPGVIAGSGSSTAAGKVATARSPSRSAAGPRNSVRIASRARDRAASADLQVIPGGTYGHMAVEARSAPRTRSSWPPAWAAGWPTPAGCRGSSSARRRVGRPTRDLLETSHDGQGERQAHLGRRHARAVAPTAHVG